MLPIMGDLMCLPAEPVDDWKGQGKRGFSAGNNLAKGQRPVWVQRAGREGEWSLIQKQLLWTRNKLSPSG